MTGDRATLQSRPVHGMTSGLRSRVAGADMMVNCGIRPLGALLGGALGAAIGVRPTLFVVTLGALAGFLWLLLSPLPRMSAIPPATEPEAP